MPAFDNYFYMQAKGQVHLDLNGIKTGGAAVVVVSHSCTQQCNTSPNSWA